MKADFRACEEVAVRWSALVGAAARPRAGAAKRASGRLTADHVYLPSAPEAIATWEGFTAVPESC
jgi:hypothetical protein